MQPDGPVAGGLEGEARAHSEVVLEHRAQRTHRKMISKVRIQPNHRRGSVHIVLAGKIRLIDRLTTLSINILRSKKEKCRRQKEKKMQQAVACHIFFGMYVAKTHSLDY